jgi:hypothetical protein
MNEYFKEQLAGGATDQFFYGIEHNDELKLLRHHGPMESFPNNLQFSRMVGSTPLFTMDETND